MSNTLNSNIDHSEPMIYHIRINGHLGPQRAEWFDGLTIALEDKRRDAADRPGG